jgi:transcriptional regulator with XRE-family HTH domain
MSIQTELAVLALSQTLRAARLNSGESQALAAQRAGVSLRSYQRMESSVPQEAGRVAVGDVLMALGVYGVNVIQALTAMPPNAQSNAPTWSPKNSTRRYGRSFHALSGGPENVNQLHAKISP